MRTLLIITCLLPLHSLLAQDVSQEELERCAAIADSLLRLSCFERLTDQGRTEPTIAPTQPATAAEEVVEESVATPAPPPAPAIPAEAPVTAAPQAAPVTSEQELGQEQLPTSREPSREDIEVTARVAEVTRDSQDYLYFHLENGQVWRQIERRYVPYPRNRPFSVVINQGMMGEYRLRVEGNGRLVPIRRIE